MYFLYCNGFVVGPRWQAGLPRKREVLINKGCYLEGGEAPTIMILPQVHLRKPCYDFYFLEMTEFDELSGSGWSLPTSLSQSEGLTEPFNR